MVTHPYEIHITVKTDDVAGFRAKCVDMGIKPILIDKQTRDGKHMHDVMTSYTTHAESFGQAWLLMAQQVMELGRQFEVVRNKIETVPWHPSASKRLENGRHFETHFGVTIRNDKDAAELLMFADEFKLHMSKNIFKRYDDGSYCQMVTARSYSMRSEVFQEYSDALRDALKLRGFTFHKEPRVEFAIWDSEPTHDNDWIGY